VKPASNLRKRIPFTMVLSDQLQNMGQSTLTSQTLPQLYYLPQNIPTASTGVPGQLPRWAQQAMSSTESLTKLRSRARKHSELHSSGLLELPDQMTEKIDRLLVEVEIEVEKYIMDLSARDPKRPMDMSVPRTSGDDVLHSYGALDCSQGKRPRACLTCSEKGSSCAVVVSKGQPNAVSMEHMSPSMRNEGILTKCCAQFDANPSAQNQLATISGLLPVQHPPKAPETMAKCCSARAFINDPSVIVDLSQPHVAGPAHPPAVPCTSIGAHPLADEYDLVEPFQSVANNSCAIEFDDGPSLPRQQPSWHMHSTGACQALLDQWEHRPGPTSLNAHRVLTGMDLDLSECTEGKHQTFGNAPHIEGFEEISYQGLAAIVGADTSALCDIVFNDTTCMHEQLTDDCVDDGRGKLCKQEPACPADAQAFDTQQMPPVCRDAIQQDDQSFDIDFMDADDPAEHQNVPSLATSGTKCVVQDGCANLNSLEEVPYQVVKGSTHSVPAGAEPAQLPLDEAKEAGQHLGVSTEGSNLAKRCPKAPALKCNVRRVLEPHILKVCNAGCWQEQFTGSFGTIKHWSNVVVECVLQVHSFSFVLRRMRMFWISRNICIGSPVLQLSETGPSDSHCAAARSGTVLVQEFMNDVLRLKGPAQSPMQELVSCLKSLALELPAGHPHSVSDLIASARNMHPNLIGSGVVCYMSWTIRPFSTVYVQLDCHDLFCERHGAAFYAYPAIMK
jgi:hypothetical protein